jgi:hypothetical protein
MPEDGDEEEDNIECACGAVLAIDDLYYDEDGEGPLCLTCFEDAEMARFEAESYDAYFNDDEEYW